MRCCTSVARRAAAEAVGVAPLVTGASEVAVEMQVATVALAGKAEALVALRRQCTSCRQPQRRIRQDCQGHLVWP